MGKKWQVNFGADKTEELIISTKRNTVYHPPVVFQGVDIKRVQTHRHLGLIISNDLSWDAHIDHIIHKANKRLGLMSRLKWQIDRRSLEIIYKSFILPSLEYGNVILDSASARQLKRLETIQYRSAIAVTCALRTSSYSKLCEELGWNTLAERRQLQQMKLIFKIRSGKTPTSLNRILHSPAPHRHQHFVRGANNLHSFKSKTTRFSNSFFPKSVRTWNKLPGDIKSPDTLQKFNSKLRHRFKPKKHIHFAVGEKRANAMLTRLRVGMSALKSHLFTRGLSDTPECDCHLGPETPLHFLIVCPAHINPRRNLLAAVRDLIPKFHRYSSKKQCNILLRGCDLLNTNQNTRIMKQVQNFIRLSKRFDA